ncbi:hypothetical protein A2814_03125 [Candidatus Nomurabacteria bacterium RIFCSPHIGHO2_01_FULL_38_19]|uniref:Uncharacterized protein n=1 Tax=Candidatus Nomurabacteria bacterium RIFCSPHIGHO2_01_FULL_38_19 TaxID=1801732 RepID=A0A1F6UQ24_9BACT|nr:MAG: hypothetical protein A2814_03125 [Candidatus Nomurabacteria bacterium RIFCSPHIGHO2_01_FULL_38_19]
MIKNNFVFVVSAVFLIIGVIHVLRVFGGWEVQIENSVIPMWVSWVAVIVAFYLSFQGFRLAKKV